MEESVGFTLSRATRFMLAKRSNTSPPLMRSPFLAPDHLQHIFREKILEIKYDNQNLLKAPNQFFGNSFENFINSSS